MERWGALCMEGTKAGVSWPASLQFNVPANDGNKVGGLFYVGRIVVHFFASFVFTVFTIKQCEQREREQCEQRKNQKSLKISLLYYFLFTVFTVFMV